MQIKLFTLRYSTSCGGFDETALQNFVRDKELLAFREHFFTANEVPHLACIVTWQEPRVPLEAEAVEHADNGNDPSRGPIRARATRDPLAALDDPGRALFQTIRAWRAEKAREDGIPPYIVFTNRQLVEVVRLRPESANALAQIPGIGPGKVKRYGEELLRLIRIPAADSPPEEGPDPDPESESDTAEPRP